MLRLNTSLRHILLIGPEIVYLRGYWKELTRGELKVAILRMNFSSLWLIQGTGFRFSLSILPYVFNGARCAKYVHVSTTRTLQNFERMNPQPWPNCGDKKRQRSWSNPPEKKNCIRLLDLHGGDGCVRSADPGDVVVPHLAVGGNPLWASSAAVGFAPNNRRRQHGSASRPAQRSDDEAEPTWAKRGKHGHG